MEPIIRVREVINKKIIGLVFSLFILIFFPVPNVNIQEKLLFFIASLMVYEDFRTQLIDMKLFSVAFFLLLSMANDHLDFFWLFVLGFLFARITFLFTTKIKDKIVIFAPEKMPLEIERLSFGYLPSLAMSWGIYEFMIMKVDIPNFLLPTHYAFLIFREYLLSDWKMLTVFAVIYFFVWAVFEYRLQDAIAKNKNIQYGFGDGDVFVLAAMFAALGFEPFMVIFFISLLVQLIFYFFQFLRDEVTFFHYGK